MTGDFTSVPLRASDRWTAARMQQGRVLLDTDWNLTIDGSARDARDLARDAIGFAGVPAGSSAFEVTVVGGALVISAGVMWIDGLAARNPEDLAYTAQAEIPALPAAGLVELYLDAFVEEVQAAEDETLLDPALDRVDTTTRTRVGWRVRAVPTKSPECGSAALPPGLSTGLLDVVRTAAPANADPCAPPDDPQNRLPDGLLRIEVIDAGTESTARFAWSYADGGDAVAAQVAGTAVTLTTSPAVAFGPGDLAEVSTLARRSDRRDHGALHTISAVTPVAGGDLVTLATPSAVVGDPPGTCLRRWDGQSVGAAGPVVATLGAADVGIAFTARPGDYLVGDWWGSRVRGSANDAVEELTAAPPDGVRHSSAPLAVVDLDTMTVLADCRRKFRPLVDIRGGTCTVIAFPGDDLQAALDALPDDGGKLCLARGRYLVRDPLVIKGKRRILIEGVGPSTVLAGAGHEAVLVATDCDDIEVTRLRVESDVPRKSPPGDRHLLGALSFLGGDRIRVRDCQINCPDSRGRAQSCIYVSSVRRDLKGAPGQVEVRGNRLEVGDQQVGVLITSATQVTVVDNDVVLSEPRQRLRRTLVTRPVAVELGRFLARHVDAGGRADGRTITLPDNRGLRVTGSAGVRDLVADWARRPSASRLPRGGSPQAALALFVLAALTEPHEVALAASSDAFLAASVKDVRAIGQAIVVGGLRASLVTVERNTILGAIQGIHVGLHGPGRQSLAADRVIVSGNTVECRVPFFWLRQRHAIYVGNVGSLTMVDNHARLVRTGGSVDGSSVDAVRVWGRLGPYLQVRGVDLTGDWRTGVVVCDTSPNPPGRRLWYVSDVLNADGASAVSVPPTVPPTVPERCVP